MNHTKIIAIQTLSQGSMLLSIQRLLSLEFVMNTKILFDNSFGFRKSCYGESCTERAF